MVKEEYYQIKVQGRLGPHWSDHFGGLTVVGEQGETIIAGLLPDQAALHGLLIKIRDLGLPLLLVKRIEHNKESQEKII